MSRLLRLKSKTKLTSPLLAILILLTVAIGIYVVGHGHAANNSPDVNSDGVVNITDLSILLSHYGTSATAAQGDLNGDGTVSITDLSILLSAWGTHPVSNLVSVPFRINAGGPTYTDTSGNVWAADQYAADGNTDTQGAGNAIANTTDDTLYQSERWGMTAYNIPVANGTYRVRLRFAEVSPHCQVAGCRVESVTAEGNAFVTNLDVYAKVGGYAADVEEGLVTVTGNSLDLAFTSSADATMVDGIEILPSTATPLPTPTATPTPTPTATPSGNQPLAAPTAPDGTWNSVYSDEFNGTSINTTDWITGRRSCTTGICNGYNTSETATFAPDHDTESGGNLNITMTHTSSDGGTHPWTGGTLEMRTKDFTYGYYEARIKMPDIYNAWGAFWLVSSQGWPPEYDIAEYTINTPSYGAPSFTDQGTPGNINATYFSKVFPQSYGGANFTYDTNFHTYGFYWEPGDIRVYMDGHFTGIEKTSSIANTPMYPIFDYTISGSHSVPDGSQIQVDYLRIWQ